MPHIDQFEQSRKKMFKKRRYRPWDLAEEKNSTSEEGLVSVTQDLDVKKIAKREPLGSNKVAIGEHLDSNWVAIREPLGSNKVANEPKTAEEPGQLGSNKVATPGYLDSNRVARKSTLGSKNAENEALLGSNKVAIGEQLDSNKVAIGEQLDSNKVANFDPQLSKKQKVDAQEIFYGLCGLQREIIIFIARQCGIRGGLFSGPITKEAFCEALKRDSNVIKNAINRLIEKGVLVRKQGKRGKGGFANFSISEPLKLIILDHIDMFQPKSFSGSSKKVESVPTTSSSLNTTTTKEEGESEKWDDLDLEPLQSIGFTRSHINQIAKKDLLTPSMVQTSIHAFAFDLKVNNKGASIKGSSLSYFMGILQKGFPYAPPENYESPEDRAMREYNERQKALIAKRKALEEENYRLAFDKWEAEHPEEELRKICLAQGAKASEITDPKGILRQGYLHGHFKEKIWPEYRNKILQVTF